MALKHCILASTVLTFTLLILSDALPASRDLHHRLQKRSGMRLCGRMLVEALAAVCQNDYYGPNQIKRNFAYNAGVYSDYDDSYPDGVLEPQSALDFFSMSQLTRNGRGVADECCLKSCSFLQLVSYCGPSPGK